MPACAGVFFAATGAFFAAAGAFFAAEGAFLTDGFFDGLAAFFAGLEDFGVVFFRREDFLACAFLAGFFELFFFGELAIFSKRRWLTGRERRLT
ncbi:MAG: hypothetical protein DLM73_03855 [Chthoniobacterales bacterium]|nr:MAG: hypothetical protein DLM73_03855 [Chthoniobacterales bacterium]